MEIVIDNPLTSEYLEIYLMEGKAKDPSARRRQIRDLIIEELCVLDLESRRSTKR